MWQKLTYKIKGVSPLIMHNGRLANPMDPLVKQIKAISGKRGKTDADLIELARLEWHGSLYISDGKYVIPSQNIEATLVNGAKKIKKGILFTTGLICPEHAVLQFKDMDLQPGALWENEEYRLVAGVVISRARVMRTRPIFREWATEFDVNYQDTILNKADIDQAIHKAGEEVGILEWRPKFGRFEVVS